MTDLPMPDLGGAPEDQEEKKEGKGKQLVSGLKKAREKLAARQLPNKVANAIMDNKALLGALAAAVVATGAIAGAVGYLDNRNDDGRITVAQSEAATASSQAAAVSSQAAAVSSQVAAVDDRVGQTEGRIDTLEGRVAEVERINGDLEELTRWQFDLDAQQDASIRDIGDRVTSLGRSVASIPRTVDLSTRVTALEAGLGSTTTNVSELTRAVGEARQAGVAATARAAAAQARADEIAVSLAGLKAQVDGLPKSAEPFDPTQLNAEIGATADLLDDAIAALDGLADSTAAEQAAAEVRADQLQDALNGLTDRVDLLTTGTTTIPPDTTTTVAPFDPSGLQGQLDTITARLGTAEQSLADAQAETDAAIAEAGDDIAAVTAAQTTAAVKLSAAEARVTTLEAQVASLLNQPPPTTTTTGPTTTVAGFDPSGLQAQINTLTSDLAAARADLADAEADITAAATAAATAQATAEDTEAALTNLETVYFAELVRTWRTGIPLALEGNQTTCDANGDGVTDALPTGNRIITNSTLGTSLAFCALQRVAAPTLPAKCSIPSGSVTVWMGQTSPATLSIYFANAGSSSPALDSYASVGWQNATGGSSSMKAVFASSNVRQDVSASGFWFASRTLDWSGANAFYMRFNGRLGYATGPGQVSAQTTTPVFTGIANLVCTQ